MSFVVEDGIEGPRVVLRGPWTHQVEQYMRREGVRELCLNHARGWSGHDVRFLERLPDLTALTILDLKIDDIEGVHHLSALRHLELSTYDATAVDFGGFPDLQRCVFYWRPGSESLFECTSLRDLFIHRYAGSSSDPFARLTNLQRLAIANSGVREIRGLASLERLEFLGLYNLKPLQSLDGVEGLRRLQALEVNGCRRVSSVQQVGCLPHLRRLQLNDGGKIDTLSWLSSNRELEEVLFYGSTYIVDGDLSALTTLPHLTKVSFQQRRHYSHTREQLKRGQTGPRG